MEQFLYSCGVLFWGCVILAVGLVIISIIEQSTQNKSEKINKKINSEIAWALELHNKKQKEELEYRFKLIDMQLHEVKELALVKITPVEWDIRVEEDGKERKKIRAKL